MKDIARNQHFNSLFSVSKFQPSMYLFSSYSRTSQRG